MLKKSLLVLAMVAACGVAQAQSTPAKKEAIARILKVQQAGIETIARNLVEDSAGNLMQRAAAALPQRVAADKQQAVAQEIQADAKKYVEETVPLVRDRALKLAPTTIGSLLEEKFTEAELKQLASILESPAYVKFQQMSLDMQKVLVEKLIADARPIVEPKLRALDEATARRLGITPGAAGGSAPAASSPRR